ncbi:hypothetical protein KGQ25_01900 [Patescibacteria group bacterium]|nr:hypothetical protein [Patescibacteria group bacterium]MDE2021488.1 hypothetical protein [Patescibacteria group bacterium]
MEKPPKAAPQTEQNFWKTRRKELLALAVAGVASIGTSHFLEENRSPEYVADWDGIRKETPFDLQPLEQIARAKVEVVGTKYIVHIGQMHGGDTLEFTKRYFESHAGLSLKKLEECQKQVEQTLGYLHDTYGINTLYMENVIPEDAASYKAELDDLRAHPAEIGKELLERAKSVGLAPVPGFPDTYRAYDLLFATEALGHTAAGKEARTDPLIAGDLKYVWGAPFLMAAQGKVRIEAAEDIDANAAAVRSMGGLVSAEGMAVRQEAAVKLIEQGERGRNESVALVYGAAHDFTKDVTRANASHADVEKFGLIRIDPNACQ